MNKLLIVLVLLLSACSGGNFSLDKAPEQAFSPIVRGTLGSDEPSGTSQPASEQVPVMRVELSPRGLANDIAAYRQAAISYLGRHPEADAILYLIHIPKDAMKDQIGPHAEVTYPVAFHRSQYVD